MERQELRTLLAFMRPYPLALPAVVALGILASVLEGFGIGLLIPFLQGLLPGGAGGTGGGVVVQLLDGYAGSFGEEQRVALVGATIVGLIIAKAVLVLANIAMTTWLTARVAHAVRTGMFRHLLSADFTRLVEARPGQLLNSLDNETWRTTQALTALLDMVVKLCVVVVFVTLLFLLSWQLTLSVAVGVVAASLLVRVVARRSRLAGRDLVAAFQDLTERAVETLEGMRIVRAFGQERREEKRFTEASRRARRAQRRKELMAGMMLPVMEVLYVPLFVGALVVAWYVEAGVPTLVAFLLLLYRLQPHIKGIDQDRVRLAGLASSVADVAAVMADARAPGSAAGGRPFAGLKRDIVFEAVSFRYAASPRSALEKVCARIGRGEVTALVGASGSGKSTMINLLFRFYDPEAGRILVDGEPLAGLDLAAWRGRLALAGQDAELFAGTIHDNIAYGRPQASRAEVEEAARLADAQAFIGGLAAGYDTSIGGRGLKLSGGQRQRIGLARALLCHPDVLVLDEATNALDGISEQSIQGVLGLLAGATTIIIIAHRLSTIRHADHVIVLEGGRVAEDGPPPTLVAAGGVFARLYDLKAVGGA